MKKKTYLLIALAMVSMGMNAQKLRKEFSWKQCA